MKGEQIVKNVLEDSKKKHRKAKEMKQTLAENNELDRLPKEYQDENIERLQPPHVLSGASGVVTIGLAATGNPVALVTGALSYATAGMGETKYDDHANNIETAHREYMEDNEVDLESATLETY